jgi:hypothetical protein
MPGGEIGEQLVEQIAMVRPISEMMVSVDDRQFRVQDRFRRLLCEPGVVWRRDRSAELGGLLGHSDAPSKAADGVTPSQYTDDPVPPPPGQPTSAKCQIAKLIIIKLPESYRTLAADGVSETDSTGRRR